MQIGIICHYIAPTPGKGWRLPNADELASILAGNDSDSEIHKPIKPGCVAPAINRNVFIDGLDGLYWSGSLIPDKTFAGNAWNVNFGTGSVKYYSRTNKFYVRLVRGATYNGPLVNPSNVISYPEASTFLRREKDFEVEQEKRKLVAAQQRERREASACDHLYPGKPVRVVVRSSTWGELFYQAVIVGVSSRNGVASAKVTESGHRYGEMVELGCSEL